MVDALVEVLVETLGVQLEAVFINECNIFLCSLPTGSIVEGLSINISHLLRTRSEFQR